VEGSGSFSVGVVLDQGGTKVEGCGQLSGWMGRGEGGELRERPAQHAGSAEM
jgi:hypothetical protein